MTPVDINRLADYVDQPSPQNGFHTREVMKMVVRRGTAAKKAAPAATRRRAPAKKAAPARRASKPVQNDVTAYASKAPTDYHKAYARWIVTEVGYNPSEASGPKAAFLAGVSIATAARAEFMKSDYLEQWREEQGIQKRGPKPKNQPEPDDTDEDFDEDEADEDSDADESDDEDFDEDSDEDSDEDDSDDDDFDEDEEEEKPAPRRGRPAKAAAKRAPAKKAAPAARGRSRAKADDDEFLF